MREGFLPLKLTALVLTVTLSNARRAWLMSSLEYSSHRNYTNRSTKHNKKECDIARAKQHNLVCVLYCDFLRKHSKYYNLKAVFRVLPKSTLTWHKLGLHSHWNSCSSDVELLHTTSATALMLACFDLESLSVALSYGAHEFVSTCLLSKVDSQKKVPKERTLLLCHRFHNIILYFYIF